MWLWWFASVIFLILCIGFAVRILSSNSQLQRIILFGENKGFQKPIKSLKGKFGDLVVLQNEELAAIHRSMRMIEENASNTNQYIEKLKERLDQLEMNPKSPFKTASISNDTENWEELYYELLERKEKLEDELDQLATTSVPHFTISQTQEKPASNSLHYEANNSNQQKERLEKTISELQSRLDYQNEESVRLQRYLDEFQQKLQASEERENQLKNELQAEKNTRHELKHVKQQLSKSQSETDELRERINEINKRDHLLQKKINDLTELESRIENAEYEKEDLRRSVEDIISENELLSVKLTELQDKLGIEKFARK